MRELTFTLRERLVLVPVELVIALKGSAWIVPLLVLAAGWRGGTIRLAAAFPAILAFLGAVAPGRRRPARPPLAADAQLRRQGRARRPPLVAALPLGDRGRGCAAAATVLLLGSVSAFLALNFTGSTPFTSLSGVKKEMRLSMPVMAAGWWPARLLGRRALR